MPVIIENCFNIGNVSNGNITNENLKYKGGIIGEESALKNSYNTYYLLNSATYTSGNKEDKTGEIAIFGQRELEMFNKYVSDHSSIIGNIGNEIRNIKLFNWKLKENGELIFNI